MKHVGSIRTLPAEGKGHSYEENMMNWKVGDRAIIGQPKNCRVDNLLVLVGEIVTLVRRMPEIGSDVWLIDLSPNKVDTYARETILRPIPDTYDGLTISSWDECPFRPRELVQ